jgi:hypothetical protein
LKCDLRCRGTIELESQRSSDGNQMGAAVKCPGWLNQANTRGAVQEREGFQKANTLEHEDAVLRWRPVNFAYM